MRLPFWRGALVTLAWILGPLVWLLFNIAPDQCAADNCHLPEPWTTTAQIYAQWLAPGMIATLLWVRWRLNRHRTSA